MLPLTLTLTLTLTRTPTLPSAGTPLSLLGAGLAGYGLAVATARLEPAARLSLHVRRAAASLPIWCQKAHILFESLLRQVNISLGAPTPSFISVASMGGDAGTPTRGLRPRPRIGGSVSPLSSTLRSLVAPCPRPRARSLVPPAHGVQLLLPLPQLRLQHGGTTRLIVSAART